VQLFQVTRVVITILNLYQIPVVTSHCFIYWKMEMEHPPWYMWLWTIWKFELSHIPWRFLYIVHARWFILRNWLL